MNQDRNINQEDSEEEEYGNEKQQKANNAGDNNDASLPGADDINSIEPSILNPQPLTPHMEVYSHPHNPPASIVAKQKKWRHYFREFLMLFLAVVCACRLLKKQDANSIPGYEFMYRQYQNFEATIFQEAQDNVRNTLNLLAGFQVNEPLL